MLHNRRCMPGCAAAQLVVDSPRLMALCADHMQPAQLCTAQQTCKVGRHVWRATMRKGGSSGNDLSLHIRVLLMPQEGLSWLTNDLGLGRLGVHLVLCLQRLERLPQLHAVHNQPDCFERPETVWKLIREGSRSCTNITYSVDTRSDRRVQHVCTFCEVGSLVGAFSHANARRSSASSSVSCRSPADVPMTSQTHV